MFGSVPANKVSVLNLKIAPELKLLLELELLMQ